MALDLGAEYIVDRVVNRMKLDQIAHDISGHDKARGQVDQHRDQSGHRPAGQPRRREAG